MKKLFIFFVFIPLLFASCKKDPEPQPVEIRSYASIISLLREPFNITWVVDGVEVPDEQAYGARITGGILLDEATEEISFTAMNASTGSQIESVLLTMDMNEHYLIVLYGSADEPKLDFQKVDATRPQSGRVRFLFHHAADTLDSIDVYMGTTEATDLVISDLSFTEYSEYFEVLDFKARTLVTLSIHGDAYDPEEEVLSYEYNDLIVSNTNYFSTVAYTDGDPDNSEYKLWLYDLPTE